MPPQKAPHRKVRTGCEQCKGRRIKCDERKPICSNCTRYSSTCSYSIPKSFPDALYGETYADSSGNHLPALTYADFELLHHWTLKTAESLAQDRNLQTSLRTEFPVLAMKYRYLMHAMLSVTALHIAYLRPDQSEDYILKAERHHFITLPLMRSGLAELNEDNCHALYACSHLVVKYAFACPQLPGSLVFSSGAGTLSEFVPLLRGAFSLHDHCLPWLAAGPLGNIIEKALDPTPSFSENPDDARLAALVPLFSDGSEDSLACHEALNTLRRVFAMIATPSQTMSTKTLIYSWAVQVPQAYMVLMSEREPRAIVILAHYCVLLKMIDSFWFMDGCAARVLSQCRSDLSQQWDPHIEWPLSIVGEPPGRE